MRFELNLGGGNFKAQFRRADRAAPPLALIVGDDELARGVVGHETFAAGHRVRPSARSHELAAGVDGRAGGSPGSAGG